MSRKPRTKKKSRWDSARRHVPAVTPSQPLATYTHVLTGPRLSAAVRCPRQAVYQALEVPAEPATPEQERMWRRGHALADVAKTDILQDLALQGRGAVVEAVIPWPADEPIGEGHADLLIIDEGRVIEITTTQGCDLADHKVLQAVAYAYEHPDASAATVLVIDPVTGAEQAYPIDVDALTHKWIAVRDQVVAGVRDGVLPDRVCRHPNDGPAMFCPYSGRDGHCFQDWAPTVDHVQAAPVFQALADIEDQLANATPDRVDELKARREEARAEALAHVEAGVEAVAGGVSIRVTDVSEGEGFSLASMRKAGWELPSELEPFVTSRTGHQRWRVRRVEVPDAA